MSKLAFSVAIAALGLAGVAKAGIVYSNPFSGQNADCSFSTTCAAQAGRGDDFAAQEFTLTQARVITGGSFTEVDLGTGPTDVNWGFILADGTGGLPGTILASGTDTISSVNALGSAFGANLNQEVFSLGTVALGPGTYYFAIQGVSPVFTTYLGFGQAASGAAETHDGGSTWASGYEGANSIAVQLTDASVPEPATWAMMLVGIGGIGAVMRRRDRAAAPVA